MNTRLILLASSVLLLFAPRHANATGLVNFMNSTTTLISTGSEVMPNQSQQTFYFALFVAPSETVSAAGFSASVLDPNFQVPVAYNTNHTTAAGRMFSRVSLEIDTGTGAGPGNSFDFLIRGWSSNLGTTWTEARDNWLYGTFQNDGRWAWFGSSTIGNDAHLGGNIYPTPVLMGVGENQVGGFVLIPIPEPSTLTLASLGAAWLLKFRRRA